MQMNSVFKLHSSNANLLVFVSHWYCVRIYLFIYFLLNVPWLLWKQEIPGHYKIIHTQINPSRLHISAAICWLCNPSEYTWINFGIRAAFPLYYQNQEITYYLQLVIWQQNIERYCNLPNSKPISSSTSSICTDSKDVLAHS